MESVTVLLACHDRREQTEKCIRSLYDGAFRLHYVVTDDGSRDGTGEMLGRLQESFSIDVLQGDGSLFWCGGMRKAIGHALEREEKTDYYALVNDDVMFYGNTLRDAAAKSRKMGDAIIVGVTCGADGKQTYGGVRYRGKGIRYDAVPPGDGAPCDTFNCNFVLLPRRAFLEAGNFDGHYRHAMADFDYGLRLKRLGYAIYTTDGYVGSCGRNDRKGTWMDTSLTRAERLCRKESPKGLPGREWFYFLRKNFGPGIALWHSATPYLKILLGK